MKKLEISKKNVVLNSNMSKRTLSLDSKKADAEKKNIVKQLEIIKKSFEQLETIINRMSIKRLFNDESNGLAIQCAQKCVSQAQAAKSLMVNLETKYSEDQKNILIQELDARISFLEEKLSKMD